MLREGVPPGRTRVRRPAGTRAPHRGHGNRTTGSAAGPRDTEVLRAVQGHPCPDTPRRPARGGTRPAHGLRRRIHRPVRRRRRQGRRLSAHPQELRAHRHREGAAPAGRLGRPGLDGDPALPRPRRPDRGHRHLERPGHEGPGEGQCGRRAHLRQPALLGEGPRQGARLPQRLLRLHPRQGRCRPPRTVREAGRPHLHLARRLHRQGQQRWRRRSPYRAPHHGQRLHRSPRTGPGVRRPRARRRPGGEAPGPGGEGHRRHRRLERLPPLLVLRLQGPLPRGLLRRPRRHHPGARREERLRRHPRRMAPDQLGDRRRPQPRRPGHRRPEPHDPDRRERREEDRVPGSPTRSRRPWTP
ncbi:hypothetical protein SMICM17S_13309 [Streptomyces microflavus]